MNIRKRLIAALALSALTVGLVITISFVPTTAHMQNHPEARSSVTQYGLQSLSPGQTARLSALNTLVEPPDPSQPPDQRSARRVMLVFDIYEGPVPNDGAPAALHFSRRVSREAMLLPGQGMILEFTASGNEFVNAAAHSVTPQPGPDGSAGVISSLEVRAGGSTIFVHPALVRGFNPQPEPPMPTRPEH